MKSWRLARKGVVLLMLAGSIAKESAAQAGQGENLSEKIINPIAFLTRLTLENEYSPSLWNSRGEENEAEAQLVMPFKAFARENLTRIKLHFETSSPDGTHGLSESEILQLVLATRSWGVLGVGITTELRAESSSLGTIAPGPAIGAVIKHGKWKYGVLNQNFLSDTFSQTEVQPILAYAFNSKWSAEIGDAQYTYDWKKDRVTELPLSGQLNRIVSVEEQRIHLYFRAQYNLKNDAGSDKWTLIAGFSLIVTPP